MANVSETAKYLDRLRESKRCVDDLPGEHQPANLTEAYCIQEAVVHRRLPNAGRDHPIGYKIACTSRHAQRLLDTDKPIFGRLISPSVYESPAFRSSEEFRVRCIEPEFGFRMATDVPPERGPYNRESIARYVAAALPSIEIVDHRFADWSTVGALALIADNAIHAAWVHGDPNTQWQHLELAELPVSLSVNGRLLETGSGRRVLGHPLTALAWLANELPQYDERLTAGDYVTTGVCTDVYLAEPGDRIEARFGALGEVRLDFDN